MEKRKVLDKTEGERMQRQIRRQQHEARSVSIGPCLNFFGIGSWCFKSLSASSLFCLPSFPKAGQPLSTMPLLLSLGRGATQEVGVFVYLLLTAARIDCPSNTPGSAQCGAVPSLLHLSTTQICSYRVIGEATFKVGVIPSPLAVHQDTHWSHHIALKLSLWACLRRTKTLGDLKGLKTAAGHFLRAIGKDNDAEPHRRSFRITEILWNHFNICNVFIKAVL